MHVLIGVLLLAVVPVPAAQMERSLPVFFFENPGRGDSTVRFMAETPALRAGFRPDSATFQIHGLEAKVHFAGANPGVSIEGGERLSGRANFLMGQDVADWKTNIPTYQKILYRNLYPGVDMTYSGAGERIKSEFIVAPGADPGQIHLEYRNATRLEIDANGDLIVTHPGAELREEAPVIFQGGKRIEGHYRLLDKHTVGFEIGTYDRSATLIIDPVISYCTYLGGSSMSSVTGVAVDGSGNLYAAGWTEALDFPIAGAIEAANQGGVDAFVVKLNAAGNALVYATYIGGRGDDRAAAIAVDSSGQAYVTGSTASANFPIASAAHATLSSSRNAFILKLNSSGSALVYSTYMGGTNYDVGTAIAVDGSGNAYVAGDTQSANFPVVSAVQGTFGGQTDAFAVKLSASGAVTFATFLGGSAAEHAGGIAIDSGTNVYVAGGTFSTDFPLAGALQNTNRGGQDAFITKLNSSGSSFDYSTYLGGNGGTLAAPEQVNAIAMDAGGNAYVAGATNSTNFPVTAGAFQTSLYGSQDAFVAKLNPTGSALVFATYLGGTSFDWATGIAVSATGIAHISGYTSSSDFPVAGTVQGAFGGLYDGFVTEVGAAGNAIVFSTLYGGTGSDTANAIALDPSANIFVGGQTNSLNLPLRTPLYSGNTGGSIGWLLRLGVTAPPPQLPTANSVAPSSGTGNAVTFTALYSHSAGANSLVSVALLINTGASINSACYVNYNRAVNQFTLANDVASSGSVTVLPGGGVGQNSQCRLNGAGSFAAISGNNLTLTVSVNFLPGFQGGKTVYLYAADASVNTGWIARGTYGVTIPPPQPVANSVSPNTSTGSDQTFTFVFSDSQNPANLADVAMLFAPAMTVANSCYIVYDSIHGTVQLAWDNGVGSSAVAVGSTAPLQNSQCVVTATAVSLSGLSLIVTANVTFLGSFSGPKNIYMYGVEANGANTGWVQNGTYTIAAGGVPLASSVVPSSGSGPGQRFTFTITDQGGSSYLLDAAVIIGSSLNVNNSCVVVFDRLQDQISLSYDIAANGVGRLTAGSNTSVSNSQCTLRGANTTIVYTATSMLVTLDLVFNASYSGAKNLYLLAAEQNVNSGWINVGGWTVTGGAPTADSIVPGTGAGSSNIFTVTVSDSVNSANITGIAGLVTSGSPSNTTNACYVFYNRAANTIGLYSNDGLTLNTKGIGYSTTLQNGQCEVGFTGMFTSGNSVVFLIQLVFKPAFNGAKSLYLQAVEPASNSGWVSRGTWTVQ